MYVIFPLEYFFGLEGVRLGRENGDLEMSFYYKAEANGRKRIQEERKRGERLGLPTIGFGAINATMSFKA